jgi:hypothetical protein
MHLPTFILLAVLGLASQFLFAFAEPIPIRGSELAERFTEPLVQRQAITEQYCCTTGCGGCSYLACGPGEHDCELRVSIC